MMGRVERATAAWATFCVWLVVPAILAHEATHAVAGKLLGARRIEHRWKPRPHVLIHPGEMSRLRIRLACLAPTIVGVVAIPAALLAYGLPPMEPDSLLFAAYAVLYTAPSDDDLRPFRQ